MKNSKFLPALICGFAVAVISIIPLISSFNCCVFIPLAGFFGVYLYNKSNENDPTFKVNYTDAVIIGLLVGVIAAFLSSILQSVMIYLSNDNPLTESIKILENLLKDVEIPGFIINMEQDIARNGFSIAFTFFLFISNLFVNIIFALIGSLIGISIINKNKKMI